MKAFNSFLVMLLATFSIQTFAYDFEVDGIQYTITSLTDLTVQVDGMSDKTVSSVIIPNAVEYKSKSLTVLSIGNNAFNNMQNLEEVIIPNSISSIGSRAFKNATSLKSILLPDNLQTLGSEVFSGCISLQSIVVPDGITAIPKQTFFNCTALESIVIGKNVKKLYDYCFAGTAIECIDLPHSLTYLGESAFSNSNIESVILPEGIEVVSKYCFANCSKLKKFTGSPTTIDKCAFDNCSSLSEINLTDELETIGDYAFSGCNSLEEFTIPNSVTNIEPNILWECPNLKKLTIGSGLMRLPVYAEHGYNPTSYGYSTLGGYYHYTSQQGIYGPYITDITYLTGLKQVIINDSPEKFSIRGFQVNDNTTTPAFANLDIDYYYVGRPLIDIRSWSSDRGSTGFTVKVNQGYGHISKLEISGECTTVPYFYQKIDTLVLGKKISCLDTYNIYMDNLKEIYCCASTPPSVYGSFPTNICVDATLYVPSGCKPLYAKAEGWENFWNIEEMDANAMSIEVINDEKHSEHNINIYDLTGRLIKALQNSEELNTLPRGIYIVNGKKVVVK